MKPCFMVHAWLWMNLRLKGNPFTGRFATHDPVGLAHYTGRNFERPIISYSVEPKIDHRQFQVKTRAASLFTINSHQLLTKC
jgi:hypothetical protein